MASCSSCRLHRVAAAFTGIEPASRAAPRRCSRTVASCDRHRWGLVAGEWWCPGAVALRPGVLPDEREQGGVVLGAGGAVAQVLGDRRQERRGIPPLELGLDVLVEERERP